MSSGLKERALVDLLGEFEGVIIAFSGGVDSAFLAFTANQVLGPRCRAVTALSPAVSQWQRDLAASFASRHRLNWSTVATDELQEPSYTSNPKNRCYFCKSELYTVLARMSERVGGATILDGTNFDDLSDFRPGRQAARELAVRSPLAEVGLTKSEIRELSAQAGLETAELPAMPCLSSRFPYGTEINAARLAQVEEAEDAMRSMGFREYRVRHFGEEARVQIAADELRQALLPEQAEAISHSLRKLGYDRVVIDEVPFKSGSLNLLPQP